MAKEKLTAETLKGIWVGITLPWNEDYSLDEASFRENIRRIALFDVAGIYTTGSTGEFYALDWPEFQHMVDIFMEVMGPTGLPTQIGCNADDTRDVLRMVEYAAKKGAGAAQITLPYWMDLTEQEMLGFFRDVYQTAPELPLVHYNIPRAKRFLLGPDYLRVLEVAPSLIGVKFTFVDEHFAELQIATQLTPNLSYFVIEFFLASAMQVGARGCYSSLVSTNPHFMLKMFQLGEERKWDEAMSMQARLAQFARDREQLRQKLGIGGMDPVSDKGMVAAGGLFVGHQRTRPPYIGWPDEAVAEVRKFWLEHYPEFIAPDLPEG